jgi:predicted heme/steroid binding protein
VSTKNTNLPKISRRQLSLRNGQDHQNIWVSYQNKVYDVTKSRLWKNGKHYEHWAGQDLTEELKSAPHGIHVFDKFFCVGILEGGETTF